MRRALLCLVLAGCAVAPVPPSERLEYALDGGGVDVPARGQRIDFGRTDHSAISAMTKLARRAPDGTGACTSGASFARWPDGTVLIFEAGAFSGWRSKTGRAGTICET
jgi:hypothetical protein